jgi:site-specific DNA-methyltransferase (adenine-specific)
MADLHHGDCLEVMRTMADCSVDAVVTDPPYFRVKDEDWDRQWDNPVAFLAWLDQVAEQWQRLLKPNGSLYCFASPQMAARVEVMLGQRFEVLNNIRWVKPQGWHEKAEKEALRSYLSPWEAVIFAEQFGADGAAMGASGYSGACDELRGFVFEPLRSYLDGEREAAGFTVRQVAEAFQVRSGSRTVTGMAGHWFSCVQWTLPTAENYAWLKDLFNGEHLRREYEHLRREYEDLRREYEDLRRPFSVTRFDPFTDVWNFRTVQPRPGKHPCEKPQSLLSHIIKSSTRPGAVVLDSFAGSGATGQACLALGREFIGIERCRHWHRVASQSLRVVQPSLLLA